MKIFGINVPMTSMTIGKKQKAATISAESMAKTMEQAKHILYGLLDRIEKQFVEAWPQPFKENDVLVLNRFNIGKDSTNRWDCGANGFMSSMQEVETDTGPAIVTVKSVKLNRDYAQDCVDLYLQNLTHAELSRLMSYEPGVLETAYLIHYGSKPYYEIGNIPNQLGIYWDVYFTTTYQKFKPYWGLNENSFHLVMSETGKLTAEMWTELVDIAAKKRALAEREDVLNKRISNLQTITNIK